LVWDLKLQPPIAAQKAEEPGSVSQALLFLVHMRLMPLFSL
jgi:hypothetical protein